MAKEKDKEPKLLTFPEASNESPLSAPPKAKKSSSSTRISLEPSESSLAESETDMPLTPFAGLSTDVEAVESNQVFPPDNQDQNSSEMPPESLPPTLDLWIVARSPEGLVTCDGFSNPSDLLRRLRDLTRESVLLDELDQWDVRVFRGEPLRLQGDVRTGRMGLVVDGVLRHEMDDGFEELEEGRLTLKSDEAPVEEQAKSDDMTGGWFY